MRTKSGYIKIKAFKNFMKMIIFILTTGFSDSGLIIPQDTQNLCSYIDIRFYNNLFNNFEGIKIEFY